MYITTAKIYACWMEVLYKYCIQNIDGLSVDFVSNAKHSHAHKPRLVSNSKFISLLDANYGAKIYVLMCPFWSFSQHNCGINPKRGISGHYPNY